jgi:adenylate cyclase
MSDWFRECSEITKGHGGTVDKFIGDAVLAYWIAPQQASQLAGEVNAALDTACDLVTRAGTFSARLNQRFPGHMFAIGIGLNAGEAVFGNVETSEIQSFTVVGNSVNVAFRLESLTKEKGYPILVSRTVVDKAEKRFQFLDRDLTRVKECTRSIHLFGPVLHKSNNF